MLLLAALSVISFKGVCLAPATHAAPVPSMELKHLQVLMRHGARTPIVDYLPKAQRGFWRCDSLDAITPRIDAAPVEHYRKYHRLTAENTSDFYSNCDVGELTLQGMEMHKELGESYKAHYADFLPSDFIPSQFLFLSSPVDRCIRSGESFITGLYPSKSPNEVIDIVTGSENNSTLTIEPKLCKDLATEVAEFEASDEFMQAYNATWAALESVRAVLQLEKTVQNLDDLTNWINTLDCNNITLPAFISDEQLEAANTYQGLNQFAKYSYTRGVASSYTMRHMLRVADAVLEGKTSHKFALFSAHDTTVAALLSTLGYPNPGHIPPFRSHISVEYWGGQDSTDWVRFVFNGEPVEIAGMNSTLVEYTAFRNFIAPYNTYCADMP